MEKKLKKVKLPLISVIITTHNRSNLLQRALNSVLQQTYKNIEIVIVNDGSKDNTEEVIKNYMKIYPNIVYIKNEIALGGNAARNKGIMNSNGQFIAGLDDDDEFTKDRIELLINNHDKKYSFVTSRSKKIFKVGSSLTKFFPVINLDIMLYLNAVGNQVLVKKEIIIQSGLFDEKLKRYQDYDMWLRIIEKFGPAKSIHNVTQIIHYEHDIASNNTVKNNFLGAFTFYKKHKRLMSKPQKQLQLFLIYKLQKKKLSLKLFLTFLSKRTLKPLIKYYLKGK